ncbi:hypothetical protein D3C77_528540 [compost metagenome]
MPSTKTLLPEAWPRMKGRSARGWPPSPAPKVMPGEVRRMSCSEVAAVCSMICCGITVTVRGVSTRGATNCGSLGSRFTRWPLTSSVPRWVASWLTTPSAGAVSSAAARAGAAHSMPAALEANRSALRTSERVSDMKRNRSVIETGSH